VVRATRAVPEALDASLNGDPLSRTIPWLMRVEIMLEDVVIEYKEGITGSHFVVGGMDLIITPLQASSDITEELRLSSVAFRTRNNFRCS
jgi:hypothetical protein